MKKMIIVLVLGLITIGCGDKSTNQNEKGSSETKSESKTPAPSPSGIGEIKSVTLNDPIDQEMVKRGKAIYDMKCSACHRTSSTRIVGPGFADVTTRRKPEWIMNMITNTDVMLDQDPAAQKMLEECLTRMPNQNVSIGDARDILEFLLNNDKK